MNNYYGKFKIRPAFALNDFLQYYFNENYKIKQDLKEEHVFQRKRKNVCEHSL